MSAFAPDMAIGPHAFLITGVLLIAVTGLLVVVRIAANARYTKNLLASDYMSIAAVIFLTGSFVCMYKIIEAFQSLSTTMYSLQKYGVATSFVTATAMWTSKAPILLLLIRLFGINKPLRITCYSILLLTGLAYLLGSAIPSGQCMPKEEDLTDPMVLMNLANCSAKSARAGAALGAISLATDLIIMVLPLPIIAKMQLPPAKKIGIMGVFLMGIFAIAASAVSLYYKITNYLGTSSEATIAMICTIIECAIAIIVSCAPGCYCFGTNFAKSALYSKITSSFSRTSVNSRSKGSLAADTKASSIKKETQYIVVEEDSQSTKSLRPHEHYNLADLEAGRH